MNTGAVLLYLCSYNYEKVLIPPMMRALFMHIQLAYKVPGVLVNNYVIAKSLLLVLGAVSQSVCYFTTSYNYFQQKLEACNLHLGEWSRRDNPR